MDRDWDAELKKIDKAMADWTPPVEERAPPAVPTPKGQAPVAPAPRGAPPAAEPRAAFRHRIATWTRVGLALLIGIGMTQWPYTHGCALKFFIYFIGALAVPAAGVWGALSSWKRRMGLAHGLSIGLIIWGLVLVAREMLPRTGYAKQPATWFCPAPAPAPPTTPTAPPPAQPAPSGAGQVPPQ